MAPHDCRRLLLAHRVSGPARIPARLAAEPSKTARADAASMKPPSSCAASPADVAEPDAPPSVRVFR